MQAPSIDVSYVSVKPAALRQFEFLSQSQVPSSPKSPGGFSYHRSLQVSGGTLGSPMSAVVGRSTLMQSTDEEQLVLFPPPFKDGKSHKRKSCFMFSRTSRSTGCCSLGRFLLWLILGILVVNFGMFLYVYWPIRPNFYLVKLSLIERDSDKTSQKVSNNSSLFTSSLLSHSTTNSTIGKSPVALRSEWEFYNPNFFSILLDELVFKVDWIFSSI